MILTISTIICGLIIINVLLLIFSCNKTSAVLKTKKIDSVKNITPEKSATNSPETVYYAATGS
ncbi:hypothetical protein J2Z57_002855 [Formosa algae]|uniref:Uncharacterized protein n=1 Tax=Formosa algae TaxID=225843 RepID=A0A9X0YM59_9FLAO|nr:hypothetical protein [Formosa algae]MDQ0336401.1 hypothetical protein [Formosa algae]